MVSHFRLLSTRLVNIGPFKDTLIKFTNEENIPMSLVLIAGANGSGKTTVLETIAHVVSLFNGGGTLLNKNLSSQEYAQVDIALDEKKISLFYGHKPHDQELQEHYLGYFGGKLDYSSDSVRKDMIAIQRCEQSIVDLKKCEGHPSLLYFPHFRMIHPVRGDAVSKEVIMYRWVFRYQECRQFPGSLDAYLVWLDYAKPEVFIEVKDFLNKYALTGKKISHVEREELKAIIITEQGGKHYLEDLSSGEQNLMALLLEIKKRLIPGSVLMIDEIENSLHEAFEYKIGHILQKLQEEYQLQIIVSSHSDTFLKLFGTQNTLIFTGIQR